MLNFKIFKLAALAGLTLAALPVHAENDSALINALVRKGVLSTKEADEIRGEIAKEEKESSGNKIKLSNSVTELKLYGDVRLRYQYDEKDAQLLSEQGGAGPSNVTQQGRWRFRLRLNADIKLGEHWFGGVELQTAQPSDSANQTYENGFDDYNIFISKAFVGWKNDWLTATAGKMPNPFYTTDLLWDADINPTGLAQTIAFHKLFGHETETAGGYSKDGKTQIPPVKTGSPWELSLVAGQFIFDDNPEFSGPDVDSSTDAYLFQTQLIGSYRFENVKLTMAPGWFTYVNGSLGGLTNSNSFNDNANVSGATRNLNLLLLPGDLSFKLAGVKTKLFWDFSYNIEGRKRTEDIYNLVTLNDPALDPDDFTSKHNNVDDYAWHVGVQFGENKKAGDWSLLASWRQVGIASIDPNINDSDWALSELNTRGPKASVSYNFTDFAIGTVSYMYAWNLRDDLFGGEATSGNGVADSNKIQVLQVDLAVKF